MTETMAMSTSVVHRSGKGEQEAAKVPKRTLATLLRIPDQRPRAHLPVGTGARSVPRGDHLGPIFWSPGRVLVEKLGREAAVGGGGRRDDEARWRRAAEPGLTRQWSA